jgi:hypothetical protein
MTLPRHGTTVSTRLAALTTRTSPDRQVDTVDSSRSQETETVGAGTAVMDEAVQVLIPDRLADVLARDATDP